jgi:hypothetical protein
MFTFNHQFTVAWLVHGDVDDAREEAFRMGADIVDDLEGFGVCASRTIGLCRDCKKIQTCEMWVHMSTELPGSCLQWER